MARFLVRLIKKIKEIINSDTVSDKSVVALVTKMEDIAAEISGVRAKISTLETKISGIESKIAVIGRKRDEKGLSDPEQAELTALTNKEIALTNEKTALTNKEIALTNEKTALTNKEVEVLKRLPLPGIHSVSMPYFINNQ